MENTEKQRAAFEAFVILQWHYNNSALTRNAVSEYHKATIQLMWESWQAATKVATDTEATLPEGQHIWILMNEVDEEPVMFYTERPSENFKSHLKLKEFILFEPNDLPKESHGTNRSQS